MNEAIQRAITAMRALCVHWDTPAWKQVKHTGKFIAELRAAADALAAQPAAEPTCEHCGGTGEVLAHAENCRDDLCALNGDEHSCVGRVEPCSCIASPAGMPLNAERFIEAPDVPADDTGLNTYYSRDLVLACIQAAIDAAQPAAEPRPLHCRLSVEFPEPVCLDYPNCTCGPAAQPARAGGDAWPNGCSRTVPEALRYLAQYPRPAEGQARFNAEHLLQLADEIERAALAAAPQQEAPTDFPTRILDLLRDIAVGPWEDGNGEPLQDDADAALHWIASRAAAPQPAAAEHVVDANKMVRPDHLVDLNKMFPPDFNALIGWLADEAHAAIRAAYPAVRTESLDRAVQSYFEAMQPAASTVPATDCHGLDTPERVCFYEQDFYVLSNFSSFNLRWRGQTFPTSEHAYHWAKFCDPVEGESDDDRFQRMSLASNVAGSISAHEAFTMAAHWKRMRRADWDDIKVDVMRDILRAKVQQHEYVRRKLLATGDRELVENSWRDDFWGWGPNRDGQNMLGKLWMEIRAELRSIGSSKEGGDGA